jgi:hypothetical protein
MRLVQAIEPGELPAGLSCAAATQGLRAATPAPHDPVPRNAVSRKEHFYPPNDYEALKPSGYDGHSPRPTAATIRPGESDQEIIG